MPFWSSGLRVASVDTADPRRVRAEYPILPDISNFRWISNVNPQTVTPCGLTVITSRLTNTGNYPLRAVSATVQPDYGTSLNPNEQVPDYGIPGAEVDFTYSLVVPSSTSSGQHQVSFQIQIVGLTTEGWSSTVESKSGSIEMTVSQAESNGGYSTTCDAQGNCGIVVNMGTETFNPCEMLTCSTTTSDSGGVIGLPIIVSLFILVALSITAVLLHKGRKRKQQSELLAGQRHRRCCLVVGEGKAIEQTAQELAQASHRSSSIIHNSSTFPFRLHLAFLSAFTLAFISAFVLTFVLASS